MSCHSIGHGLNEVTRVVLREYDEGNISYESTFRILKQCRSSVNWCDGNKDEAVACMYDRCSRCFKKGIPLFEMSWNYSDGEATKLFDENAVGWHLCQDCINELKVQEHVGDLWDIEKQSQFDYGG